MPLDKQEGETGACRKCLSVYDLPEADDDLHGKRDNRACTRHISDAVRDMC
jgi:hypothetical protein